MPTYTVSEVMGDIYELYFNQRHVAEESKTPEPKTPAKTVKAELSDGLVPGFDLKSLNIDIPKGAKVYKSSLSNFDNDPNEELLLIILKEMMTEKYELALYYIYDTVTKTIEYKYSFTGDIFAPQIQIGDLTFDGLPDVFIKAPLGGANPVGANETVISFVNNKFTDIGYPYLVDLNRSIIDNEYAVIYSEKLKTMYSIELTEEEKAIVPVDEEAYLYFEEPIVEMVAFENGHVFKSASSLNGITSDYNYLAEAEIMHKFDSSRMEWVPVSLSVKGSTDRKISKIGDRLFSAILLKASFRHHLTAGMLPGTQIQINSYVSDVYKELGKPDSIDEYDHSLAYEDKNIYIYHFNERVTSIGFGEGAEIFGIKIGMKYNEIVSKLGPADHEYYVNEVDMDPIGNAEFDIVYNQFGRNFYISFDSNYKSISALLK